MPSALAFAGAVLSGTAVGAVVTLRTAAMGRPPTVGFTAWLLTMVLGPGMITAWIQGPRAAAAFLAVVSFGALAQRAFLARIASTTKPLREGG